MKTKKKTKSKRIFLLMSLITGVLAAAYLAVGFLAGEGLLRSDLKSKGRVAGAVVTAFVRPYGPPQIPVVTASSSCTPMRTPYVKLEWPADQDATSFDIYRDGAELMLAVTENRYGDENVTSETDYNYYVVANGPKGTATSENFSVSVEKCPTITDPYVRVTAFDGRNVSGFGGTPATKNRRPVFAGSTNIPSADIELTLNTQPAIFVNLSANENGFWQWTPTAELKTGEWAIDLRATDLIDPGIVGSSVFNFKIEEEDEEDEDEEEEKEQDDGDIITGETKKPTPIVTEEKKPVVPSPKTLWPFRLEVSAEETVYRGALMEVGVTFREVMEKGGIKLTYSILSKDRTVIFSTSDITVLKNGRTVRKKIPLPYGWELGEYILQVSAAGADHIVSEEKYFVLKDRPILSIGGQLISYPDIMKNLGWLVIFMLIFILVIAFLVLREHQLYQRAKFHITGKVLKKKDLVN